MRKRIPKRPRNLRPRTADAAVIDQLQRFNTDLTKPRPVTFYLYFPGKEGAEGAREALVQSGFDAEVHESAAGPEWLCLAFKEVEPQLRQIAALSSFLSELAGRFGGIYDGWETEVGGGDPS